jgi:hypothetical protein
VAAASEEPAAMKIRDHTEITLVWSTSFEEKSHALKLRKFDTDRGVSRSVSVFSLDKATNSHFHLNEFESLLDEFPSFMDIGAERQLQIEELVESIQIQPRLECVQVIDGLWYQLMLKRRGIELRLSWNSITPDSWNGVTELAEALEGLYRELNKDQLKYLR